MGGPPQCAEPSSRDIGCGFTHPTSHVSLDTLCSAQFTEESVDNRVPHIYMDWLDSLPTTEATRIKRRTNVSHGPRYTLNGPNASDYDAECTAAPIRIPPWVLLAEEIQALFEGGHGISPELVYSRGVPDASDLARPTSTRNHAPSSS